MKFIRTYLRKFIDKLTKHCYDGPDLPLRFRDEILLFRVTYPIGGIEECIQYAISVAEKAYQAGFLRGIEWQDKQLLDARNEEARLIDEALNNYDVTEGDPALREILETGRDPNNPLKGLAPEHQLAFFDALGEYAKTHRVVLVDENGKFLKYFGDSEGIAE
jgi:hypothetical protein